MPKATLRPMTMAVRIRPEAHTGGHAMSGPAAAKQLQGWDDKGVTVGWTSRAADDIGHAIVDGKRYDFPDTVLGPEASQEDVYARVMPPLVAALLGPAAGDDPSNVMLYAYGQTGTGKTHTMLGPDGCLDSTATMERWGLFPRLVFDVFQQLRARGGRFIVSLSAVEFYLMAASDLLTEGHPPCMISETNVIGARSVVLRSPEDILPLLALVKRNRHTRTTNMNNTSDGAGDHSGSSRGHAAFVLHVAQLDASGTKFARTAFNLIDMAGAERPGTTGGGRMSMIEAGALVQQVLWGIMDGAKLPLAAQGVFINFELSMLGDAICSATDTNKQGKPYKAPTSCTTDAMRFMGGAFGGAALCAAMLTLSQAPQCGWETWFTCNFGMRMKKLRMPRRCAVPYVAVDKLIAKHEAIIKENKAALPAAKEKYFWVRSSAITASEDLLRIIRETTGTSTAAAS